MLCAACSAELPAATLSLLPGNPLTQLLLTTANYDIPTLIPTLQELSALTNLRELRLAGLRPAPAQLACVLPALTSLTGLLLVEPSEEVVQALPACLQELAVVRGVDEDENLIEEMLSVGHMTNLTALHLVGADTLDDEVLEQAGGVVYGADGGTVWTSSVVLPSNLKWLSVEGVGDCGPLRPLKQLKHLRFVWAAPHFKGCLISDDLTCLTTLTRVELIQRGQEPGALAEVGMWSELSAKVPLYVPSLHVEIPTDATQNRWGAFGGFRVLGTFTSLTCLVLSRRRARRAAARAAAILTAAAAAGGNGVGAGAWLGGAEELAGALAKLTNLCELQLEQVPAVSEGGAAAVGVDWLPVIQAVAGLPQLHELSVEGMPLGPSVSALSSVRSLTSLSLVKCQVDDAGMVGMVTGMQCSLRQLTVGRPRGLGDGGPMLTDAVLVAIVQQLTHLTRLCLEGQVLAPGAVTGLADLARRGVVVDRWGI